MLPSKLDSYKSTFFNSDRVFSYRREYKREEDCSFFNSFQLLFNIINYLNSQIHHPYLYIVDLKGFIKLIAQFQLLKDTI